MVLAKRLLIILCILSVNFFIINCVASIIIKNDWVLNTTSNNCDITWKLRWIKYWNDRSTKHEDLTAFSIDNYDPLLGWSPKKSFISQYDNLSFNSDGIRGQQEYSLEKKSGTTRILVIGDSFSFGVDVKDNETYSSYLSQFLPNSEVLNMGVHGYGLDQMTLRLERDGLKYKPDLIIYSFISDDAFRTLVGFRDYMKPKYHLVNSEYVLSNIPISKPEKISEKISQTLPLVNAFSLIKDRVSLQKKDFQPEVERLSTYIWTKTINLAHENHSQIVFLFLPVQQELISPTMSSYEQFAFKFCESAKITCLSARPYFNEANSNGVKLDLVHHYNSQMHNILALGLAKDLQKIYNFK